MIWLTQEGGPGVLGVDERVGRVSKRFNVGGAAQWPQPFAWAGTGSGVAYGDGALWLARGPAIARIDPRDGRVIRRFPIPDAPLLVSFADGAVWVVGQGDGVMREIDPVENRVVAVGTLHGWITDMTVGGGFLWASAMPAAVVFKVSENDLSVQGELPAGVDPERVSFGGGVLWIANTTGETVSRIDPGSGVRSELILKGSAGPNMVSFHRGSIWVSTESLPGSLAPLKGPELRISTPGTGGGCVDADLSTGSCVLDEQLAYATCANLLAYPDSSGPGGLQLRPEIAAAMPLMSQGGRTYTFRIRQGFRFSPPSNELVTAETFKHTIERALSPKLQNPLSALFASDIVGVTAYRAGRAPHISGIRAGGRTLSITLVRPAGDLLTRLSMWFFCPVPVAEPVGTPDPIPSAGPYYVASVQAPDCAAPQSELRRRPTQTIRSHRVHDRCPDARRGRTCRKRGRRLRAGGLRLGLVVAACSRGSTRPALRGSERSCPSGRAAVLP
jgi:streptogramin lyase